MVGVCRCWRPIYVARLEECVGKAEAANHDGMMTANRLRSMEAVPSPSVTAEIEFTSDLDVDMHRAWLSYYLQARQLP